MHAQDEDGIVCWVCETFGITVTNSGDEDEDTARELTPEAARKLILDTALKHLTKATVISSRLTKSLSTMAYGGACGEGHANSSMESAVEQGNSQATTSQVTWHAPTRHAPTRFDLTTRPVDRHGRCGPAGRS